MSFLASQRIQRVTLEVPHHGTAWAHVETEAGPVATGPATLTVGDVVMMGAVVPGQSGDNGPSSWVGIWRNGTAWDTVLPSRPAYQNDSGVRLLTVLVQLADDCGAVIAAPPDMAMGPFWARAARDASGKRRTGRNELDALVKGRYLAPWWIDSIGVTRFGNRPGIPVPAAARVTVRDLTRGSRVVGTESPVAFMPGNVFEGTPIERVIIRESSAKITVQTWTS